MKKSVTVCAIVVCITLGFCTQSLALDPAGLIAIRADFAKALDDHDLDKIVSFFTEDGVFDLVPEPAPFAGHVQIRAAFEAQFTSLFGRL